jgi:hypothetical protein
VKNKTLCLLLIACPIWSLAQPAKDEVTNAVKDYVEAFYYGDTSKIHRSISVNVVKYGYYIPKAKTIYEGEPMSFKEMIDYAADVKKRGASPNVDKFPRRIEIFDVQDQTASAKLTAWWGTDYLLLAKINDRWMITHVLWQSPPIKSK